jgi:hypothetical protein
MGFGIWHGSGYPSMITTMTMTTRNASLRSDLLKRVRSSDDADIQRRKEKKKIR